MKTFQQIGTDAGALVEEKNRAYGSSFATAGAAMRLLYPNGITPEQMHDALVLVRIWDKLMRIATDRDALGESPYHDIIGYGILGVHMHQATEGEPQAPCGSVSAKVAANESQAPSDFAAPSAPPPTTPSESASSARSSETPSQQPSSNTSARTGALAHSAEVAALFARGRESNVIPPIRLIVPMPEGAAMPAREEYRDWKALGILSRREVIEAARYRNEERRCAHCGSKFPMYRSLMNSMIDGFYLEFDSQECVDIFKFSIGGRA